MPLEPRHHCLIPITSPPAHGVGVEVEVDSRRCDWFLFFVFYYLHLVDSRLCDIFEIENKGVWGGESGGPNESDRQERESERERERKHVVLVIEKGDLSEAPPGNYKSSAETVFCNPRLPPPPRSDGVDRHHTPCVMVEWSTFS